MGVELVSKHQIPIRLIRNKDKIRWTHSDSREASTKIVYEILHEIVIPSAMTNDSIAQTSHPKLLQ